MDGTLKPDGTREWDQKPSLPPGRVQVVLRPAQEPAPAQEGWWPYMQRIRAEREAAGYRFLTEAEMEAHIQCLREEGRLDEWLRQSGQELPSREHPRC
jgi:hypothetical protein